MQDLIRIANSDLDGSRSIYLGMTKIKGISFMLSNAICQVLEIKKDQKASELEDATIKRIEDAVQNPQKFGIPNWMFNRRKDPETGVDTHISLTDVRFIVDNDLKTIKKIKSYKGLRHQWGLPVRGQRTKSNFRKNKGKATGVKRNK